MYLDQQRVRLFIYPEGPENEGVELPYRVLVIGNFSGSDDRDPLQASKSLADRSIYRIRKREDFDTVLQEIDPWLTFTVPNRISADEKSEVEIRLDFKSIRDFHPDAIVTKVPILSALLEKRKQILHAKLMMLTDPEPKEKLQQFLQGGVSNIDQLLELLKTVGTSGTTEDKKAISAPEARPTTLIEKDVQELIGKFATDDEKSVIDTAVEELAKKIGHKYGGYVLRTEQIDEVIAAIDERLSDQMDEILHHNAFRRLESAWRAVHYLVQGSRFSEPVSIGILDATKEQIRDDLSTADKIPPLKASALWQKVYWQAFNLPGKVPYTVMIADFQFDNSEPDIELLRQLGILGEWAQTPFIGNAAASFFGYEHFQEVTSDRYLENKLQEGSVYASWRELREEDCARYLGLALPRFMGRLFYGKETDPVKSFNYTETFADDGNDNSLWVNSSFALAANMIRCFEMWGWSAKMVGIDAGGRVENLPVFVYEEDNQSILKEPVEALLGQVKDLELSHQGFIPLVYINHRDYACFFEMPTMARPQHYLNNPEAQAGALIKAHLQYVLLMTRIAHYLNYTRLSYIDPNAGIDDLKAELCRWLDTLVPNSDERSKEMMVRSPLRSYTLEVHEIQELPEYFQVFVELRPYPVVIGFDVKLSFSFYLSRKH